MRTMISTLVRLCCAACVVGALSPLSAAAQTMPGKSKKSGSVEGSPLDTIMSTRLWTTPPTAKDFVRETRPEPGTLDYTPLHGEEPNRPKPRDAANVQALKAELERDIQMNEKRAQSLGGVSKPEASAGGNVAPKPGMSKRAKRTTTKGAATSAK